MNKLLENNSMGLQVRGNSQTCVGGVLDIAGIIMEEVKLNYKIEKRIH